MIRDMYLRTNLIFGRPSSSNFWVAILSPIPPIDSGPKRCIMAPASAAMQEIIGTERPLIALVARNWSRAKNWQWSAVGITVDHNTSVDLRLGWLRKEWKQHQTLHQCNWLGLVESRVCGKVRIGKSRMARVSFKFEAGKYKSNGAHISSLYLIRWRAFKVPEGSSKNWRDTSILVLSRTCGATMKVAICVARAQKGLTCPIRHIEWISLQ